MYRPITENRVWNMMTNNELQQLYGEPEILGVIEMTTMNWTGHLRMVTEENMYKRIF